MRSLSWRSILHAVTFLLFALAIVFWILTFTGWLVTDPGVEPLNVLAAALVSSLGGLLALLKARTAKDTPVLTYSPTPEQRLRNRRAMLELVRNFWVKGVLEPSLHGAVMIELGLERRGHAVERPWDTVLQRPDQVNRPIPRGTRIISVFNAMNKELLILGAPGSGKTTMLLELARDAIARAEQDLTQSIPVVFNLSSWPGKRQPIAEWLVDELNTKYNIPQRVARLWVEWDELLLLLDGLDEVALKCREDCVGAINEFRQEHLVPLVVCSRVADYEALTARLRLQGAVLLQPLTPRQIDDYLGGADLALSAVRETLQDDLTLQELAETPLMLSIMTLAYQGVSVEDLQALDTVDARRQHLFDAYVQRMFERRRADQSYSSRQTVSWLAWLARNLSQHNQTVFLIEQMQPSWLPPGTQLRRYALVASVIHKLSGPWESEWVLKRFLNLLAPSDRARRERGKGRGFLELLAASSDRPAAMSKDTEVGWESIDPVELLKWSWRGAGTGLLAGLATGLGTGLVNSLFDALVDKLFLGIQVDFVDTLFGGLFRGMFFASILGPFFGLVLGLRNAEVGTTMIPNQGIRQSARNAMVVGSTGGLALGLVVGLTLGLIRGRIFEPWYGLTAWLVGGLFIGLRFGGRAVIKHFALRLLLWRSGYIPWNYIRFLDYATERVILRKVGGGYIFVYRPLQHYFAGFI